MDVLSDVLRAVRLTGAVYFKVSAIEPWVAKNPSMRQIGAAMMPHAEHVIPFHIVMVGHAWARPADDSAPAAFVDEGDILMFPLGAAHVIASDRDARTSEPADVEFYRRAAASGRPFTLMQVGVGRDGERAQLVCGYLGCDASPFNPLLEALPGMLVVHEHSKGSGLMKELLLAVLEERESHRAGTESILAKLSELMLVRAARGHMDGLPDGAMSWLCALRDKHVGRALERIHAEPARNWTVAQLAGEAGLSRSAFAERFSQLTGDSPMRYIGRWRMQLASRLLEEGADMGRVAGAAGYQSDAAFQRAFKRFVGVTPGEWRRRQH
jgi:AraC-like DNA-binding protein